MQATSGQEVQGPSGTQQERLAQQLVACLGRDSAIHVCKVNGWAGILAAIVGPDGGGAA